MKVLRRQWETMKGRTMRAGTPPPAGGARPERARDDGDGDTPPPKMVRRRAPNLKQRLSEVLIPVLNPMRNWNFNTRVTGLNLSNASIGPEGAKFLASALHGRRNADGTWVFNSVLRSLNLEFNSIGDEGAIALFEALAPRWVTDGADDASDVSGHSEFDQNEWMRSTAPASSTPTRSDGSWVCARRRSSTGFLRTSGPRRPRGGARAARRARGRVGVLQWSDGRVRVPQHIGQGVRAAGDALAPGGGHRPASTSSTPSSGSQRRQELLDQGPRTAAPLVAPRPSGEFNPRSRTSTPTRIAAAPGRTARRRRRALSPSKPRRRLGVCPWPPPAPRQRAARRRGRQGDRRDHRAEAERQHGRVGVPVQPEGAQPVSHRTGDTGACPPRGALPRVRRAAGRRRRVRSVAVRSKLRELHLGGATGPGGAKALAELSPRSATRFLADVKVSGVGVQHRAANPGPAR